MTSTRDGSVPAAAERGGPRPPGQAGSVGRRTSRRLRRITVAGVVVLALGGVGVAAAGVGGRDPGPPDRTDLPPATAKVTRGTLVNSTDVEGTLGYTDTAPLTGRRAGTVTWLPAVGSRVRRGESVYRVDDLPVPLLYGSMPLYRKLQAGLKGSDVEQFEKNLRALGYRGFTVDKEFTDQTARAVKEWQKRLGVAETGALEPGHAVLAPGEIRVAEQKMRLGDPATGEVLTTTSTTRVVTAELDLGNQSLVKPKAKVTVELPGGTAVTGTVARADPVTSAGSGEGGSGNGGSPSNASNAQGQDSAPKVKVLVTVPQQQLGPVELAPVTLRLVAEQRENVLVVPVAALLALAEGGYGVQVVEGGTSRIVKVEAGMFASGKVEITGAGITEGTVVGVPQ